MKILMTSCSTANMSSRGQAYVTSFSLLVKLLESMGHDVDVRAVKVMEDDLADRYDVAVCCVYNLRGLTCANSLKFGLVNAALQLPYVFMNDDWAWSGTARSLKYMWRCDFLKDMDVCRLMHVEKKSGATAMVDAWCNKIPKCLMPMWQWGDRSKIFNSDDVTPSDVVAWDPSSVWLESAGPTHRRLDKKRQWVLASLHGHDRFMSKLDLRWDVVMQCKTHGAKWTRIPESDVEQTYDDSWGVVSWPYPHAGSGFWRMRLLHAAFYGCVCATDPREVSPLDGYYVDCRALEDLPDASVASAAKKQADILYSSLQPMESLRATINDALRTPNRPGHEVFA